MKTIKRLFALSFTVSLLFTACDQREFDMPPLNEPVYSDTATMTIAAFKAKYASVTVTQITDDDVISGIIVANDVSGNFYKELTIMDSTAGIKVSVNQGDLYVDFRLGQRIFIECKDLYVGKYGGYMQVGGLYNSGIGQMTWETAQAHIFKDGWPDPDNERLTPEIITLDVVAAEANLGKLITLENVYFTTGGTEVCAAAASDGSTQTLSKTLASTDYSGKTITVRLSSASDFANKTLPAGNGNLTGILSVYNSTYQFTPRDSMDFAFVGFGAGFEDLGSGTSDDPYLVNYVLSHQTSGKTGWVKGYIVGALQSGVNASNTIDSNDDIEWTSSFMNNTLVIAADSLEDDWQHCVVVNLPAGSPLRDSVNLSDYPGHIRHLLAVTGTFENYLGAAGVTVETGDKTEYWLDEPSDEPIVTEGDGSAENPYSVAQAMVKQGESSKWVTGYIVGFINTATSPYAYTYNATGAIASNLILADSPSETVDGNCLPVQLSYGTAPRTALNLVDNPGNIGKKVSVCGSLESYFSVAGIKSLSDYSMDEEEEETPTDTIVTLPYSEAFSNTLGLFSTYNVTGTGVWTASSYDGDYFAKVTGYYSSISNTNEDWLISPSISLSGKTSATILFDHAVYFKSTSTPSTENTMWITTNYTSGAPSTATWTQLTIPNYQTTTKSYDFVSSGNISIPSGYMGSNVRIAFKYIATTSTSSTWEVKNMSVTGN